MTQAEATACVLHQASAPTVWVLGVQPLSIKLETVTSAAGTKFPLNPKPYTFETAGGHAHTQRLETTVLAG